MAKNQFTFNMTEGQLAETTQALDALESTLSELIGLDNAARRSLTKMGQGSEVFCRRALSGLQLNPQIVPPSLDVAVAISKLEALERLLPVVERLRRLAQRATDTQMAVGSDVMDAALEGYGLLKVSGKRQGLDALYRDLAARWAKPRRDSEAAVDA
ncbi:hypothetical protein ACFPN1_04650 [Lysobacter yangpyeongensis]|uniref:Uncharacterized protein n=1 Tax=Lysobacter yangpyeongensis TaxID=346182 RepID=A0ABW0SKV4_9GAMM